MFITWCTLIFTGSGAVYDIFTHRIPNLITFPAIVFGLILNTYFFGFAGSFISLAGTIAGLLLLIIPFALGGMGAGDVKILAAVGALNGPQFVFYTFLYAAIFGGVMALVVTLFKGKSFSVIFNISWAFKNLKNHIFRRSERQQVFFSDIKFPYGLSIFLGTAAAYWLRWYM